MQTLQAVELAANYVYAVDVFRRLQTSRNESVLFLRLCDFSEPFRERGEIVWTIISIGQAQFFFGGGQVALVTPDERYFGFSDVMARLDADLFYEEE